MLLQSPRQAETFSGVQMDRNAPRIPMAVFIPPIDNRVTNSFSWGASMEPMRQADGYELEQVPDTRWFTNYYTTTGTNLTIAYVWPNGVQRWHYRVRATNEWGESDWTTNRVHNPPYPPDRMTVTSQGPVYQSANMFSWSLFTNRPSTFTVMISSTRYFRGPGLVGTAWNPMNE